VNLNKFIVIEQVALNKLNLLLKIPKQNIQTLQLFAMNIKIESIDKSYLKCQVGGLE
jgi:hypothetical protein